MKHLAWLLLGGALAALAASCEPELTLDAALEGKPCAPGNQCLEGFSCDPIEKVCMPSNAGQGGVAVGQSGAGNAASGRGGSPSTGGSDNVGGNNVGGAVSGGSGGTGGSGGGIGGSGGVVSGGAGGVGGEGAQGGDDGGPDASAPVAGAGGCTPGPLYTDLDGDGHGSGQQQGVGCPSEDLAAVGDDCFDAVPENNNYAELVYPGQDDYFYVGYPDADGPNGFSFDYNCSGEEEPDPSNDPLNEALPCESFGVDDCAGSGWQPYLERPSGNGILSICGSEVVYVCVFQNGFCNSLPLPPGLYLCH